MNSYYDYPTPVTYSNMPSSSNPYPNPRKANSPSSLSVSTSVQHDPSEETARPSNAHVHTQFHSLPAPSDDNSLQHAQQPDQSPSPDSSLSTDITRGLSRPLTQSEQESLAHLDRLKYFLATAPSHWQSSSGSSASSHPTPVNPHPALHRFLLPSQEYVSCVLWANLYHITGTDIVRALVFRFEAFGRPVRNIKKFEEGIFSDLRNLKPGIDACLEEPKSAFLDLLFKHQAIRTQKKQKVFYWFSVPHDRLFLDALERDLKREKMGLEPTTRVEGEPAQSFVYDAQRGLYEQFCGASSESDASSEDDSSTESADVKEGDEAEPAKPKPNVAAQNPYLAMFSLFEGSPLYKQRRKKSSRAASNLSLMFNSEPPHAAGDRRSRTLEYPPHYHRANAYSTATSDITAEDMFRMQARGELIKQEERPYTYGLSSGSWEREAPPRSFSTGSNYSTSSALAGADPSAYASSSTSTPPTKAYECPLFSCGRMFKLPEQLQSHLRKHALANNDSRIIAAASNANTAIDTCQVQLTGPIRDIRGDEEGMVAAIPTTGATASAGRIDYPGSDYDPYTVNAQQQQASFGDYPQDQGGQWASAPAYSASNEPSSSFGPLPSTSPAMQPPIRSSSAASSSSSAQYDTTPQSTTELHYDYNGTPSHSHHHQHHMSISAPAFKRGFDHEHLAQVSSQMQQLPHTPYGASMSLTSSPPRYGYASSGTSSSASSVSGGSPSSSIGSGSGGALFLYDGGSSSANASSSNGGPTRRHRSMTPSLMRTEEGSPFPSRRPLTASSTAEFTAALQQAQAQQQQQPSRGRGYHPYANGYASSRSASLSTNGSANSAQSSPMNYTMPLSAEGTGVVRGMMRMNLERGQVPQQQVMGLGLDDGTSTGSGGYAPDMEMGMYRTDSPAEFPQQQQMFDATVAVSHPPPSLQMSTMHPVTHHHQQQYVDYATAQHHTQQHVTL